MKKKLIFLKIFFLCFLSLNCLVCEDVTYSPDENFFAKITNDGDVKIYQVKVQEEQQNIDQDKQPIYKIVSTEACVLKPSDNSQISAVSWSSDGQFIACGSIEGDIDLWLIISENIIQIKIFKTLNVSECLDAVSHLSWSEDGNFLAVVLKDCIIKILGDFVQNSGKEFSFFDLNKILQQHNAWQIDALDWSPCGKFIAVSVKSIDEKSEYKINSIILDVSHIYEKTDLKMSFSSEPQKLLRV